MLGGLLMLFAEALDGPLGGLLALAGGLWFVAGPTVSMLWNDGELATGAAFGDNGITRARVDRLLLWHRRPDHALVRVRARLHGRAAVVGERA